MKGIALLALFCAGGFIGTIAAMHGHVVGVAGGAATMGGCLGYLIGRIDLRHDLNIPAEIVGRAG